ncbi:uncharacterized protein LOC129233826 [Uloborus diversus]|uniref:uncharacterized protein LOC129233826 n=1 Tax=Uloborus diversus TaxID=327109 RepID=UPI002409D87B|nr:uncharacterized protein LOC129233826 [Uloborus diversus]
MENFKFEDYRHPWETGDHWELKREFMERYKDTYPIERLLCLAQAYSNIELLHCSYPVDVMKEVHELSKPLKACKIFRGRGGIASSHSNDATTPTNRGKRKVLDENAGKKTKFINFCAASDVSEMDPNSMCRDKKASEQDLSLSSGAEAASIKKERHEDPVALNKVVCQHASDAECLEIILYRLQQFAMEIRREKRWNQNVPSLIHNASSKTKIKLRYDASEDRKVSYIPKPRVHVSDNKKKKKKTNFFKVVSEKYIIKLYIGGIFITSAEDPIKKTAKLMANEKALEILLDSSNLYARLMEAVKNACESSSVSSICEEMFGTPAKPSTGLMEFNEETESIASVSNLNSDVKQASDMEINTDHELDIDKTKLQLMNEFGRELMLKFTEEISYSQGMEEHVAITTAARMMNINVDIYEEIEDQSSPEEFFVCTLFVKSIIVGIGKGKSKKEAMRMAASYSITHLLNPKIWLHDMHGGNVSSNDALDLYDSSASAGDICNVSLDSNDIGASTCQDTYGKIISDDKKYILLSSDNPKENPYQCIKRLSATLGTCSITLDDVKSIFAWIKNMPQHINCPTMTVLTVSSEKAKISQYISYDFSANEDTTVTSKQHLCEIFFKNILISSGCGRSKVKAKFSATDAAVEKLKNMKNFIFSVYDESRSSAIASSESSNAPAITSPFIINKSLLDSTLQKRFVIMDNSELVGECQRTATQILNHSSVLCQKPIVYQNESVVSNDGSFRHRFDVFFDGKCIGTGMGVHKNEAKKNAAANALSSLKKVVYTIKIRDVQNKNDVVINRHQLINAEYGSGALTEDTNIGCKMLKSMGWTGGGIGKTSGIVEPIWADKTSFRGQGFGFESSGNSVSLRDLRKKIQVLLQEFKISKSFNDLIFAKDFTKEERKEIHCHASRLSLNSTSYGIENHRQLFVRNKFTALELLDYLVKNGGSTNKYYLVDQSKEE